MSRAPERDGPGQPSRDASPRRQVGRAGPVCGRSRGKGRKKRPVRTRCRGQAASGLPIFSTAICTRAVIGAKAVSASFTVASLNLAASLITFSIAALV